MARKGSKMTDEQKQAARQRTLKYWETRRQQQRQQKSAVPESAAAAVGLPNAGLPAALSKPVDEYRIDYDRIEMGEDYWDKQVRADYNPFDEQAEPFVNANHDLHFAWQSPRIQNTKGTRGMTPVLRKNGTEVKVANMVLYWEPREQRNVKEKRNLKKAAQQAAAPELSYREIQEQINRSRGDVGVRGLADNEIIQAHVGKVSTGRFADDGSPIYMFAEGAAQIGVKTVTGVG